MRKTFVSVIDNDFSSQGLYDLSGNSILIYESDGVAWTEKLSPQGIRSHGTICSSILAEALPGHIRLVGYSCSDGDGKLTLEKVCMALKDSLGKSPDYLCMSIGSENWLEVEELGKLTKQLANKGTHIFAACANTGHIAFPAAYPWVTGVRYEPGVACLYQEGNSPTGSNLVVGDFTTPVLERLAAENSFFKCRTNSMAAPYALGKMLSEGLTLTGLPMWAGCNSKEKAGEWPMPTVALYGSFQRMKELLALLQKESYQAALLTSREESDWTSMVLYVAPENLPEWRKPLEKAGILLIDAESSLASVQKCTDCLVDLRKQSVLAAYAKILQFFGTEEGEEKA